MRQLTASRALRVPLLAAFALALPGPAAAADAGPEQDAGAGEASDAGTDAGVAPDLQLLFPPLGATDVVINPSLLLRVQGAALDPALSSESKPASFEGLLLRDPLGSLVAVGSLLALQPPRIAGVEPRVELSSPRSC